MYLISELAAKAGLSRTTLLYYEKLGLVTGKRKENGYRFYDDSDLQRLYLIQQLQSAGLSLKECQMCVDEKMDEERLRERLLQLDREIEEKHRARDLLLALIGEKSQREFLVSLINEAPGEYERWLRSQGFEEKEALRIKWLSKDMNQHERYMNDFLHLFSTLDRWGPGSESATHRALSAIPKESTQNVLEIGCGKGSSTMMIAGMLDARVTAVDNEALAIDALERTIQDHNLDTHVVPVLASMTDLPFERRCFDAIWAEGCVYIMGMENALRYWKPFLKEHGYLMVSDLVWLTKDPDPDVRAFWREEYPDISDIASRLETLEKNGYTTVDHFSLDLDGWRNYWEPLEQRLNELKAKQWRSQVISDIEKEIAVYKKGAAQAFTYQYFVLRVK
ncbi:MAG: MerR family transcriptional regulator [Saccharospirillum sp.]